MSHCNITFFPDSRHARLLALIELELHLAEARERVHTGKGSARVRDRRILALVQHFLDGNRTPQHCSTGGAGGQLVGKHHVGGLLDAAALHVRGACAGTRGDGEGGGRLEEEGKDKGRLHGRRRGVFWVVGASLELVSSISVSL